MNASTLIWGPALLAACVDPGGADSSFVATQPPNWPSPEAAGVGEGGLPRDFSSGADATWRAGDEIPGWEDFDCQGLWEPRWRLSTNQQAYGEWVNRAVVSATFGFTRRGRCSVERPEVVDVFAQGPEFDVEGRPLDILFMVAEGSFDQAPHPRGQGWYVHRNPILCGHDERPSWIYAEGDSVGAPAVQDICYRESTDIWHMPSTSYTCISRLRPDQIRGTSWSWPLGPEEGGWAYPEDQGWIAIDFDIKFPPHSGYRVDQRDALPSDLRHATSLGPLYYYSPAEPDLARGYCGDGDYDSAWPWEDITDPLIREIVYERYHPWQADYLPEDVGR